MKNNYAKYKSPDKKRRVQKVLLFICLVLITRTIHAQDVRIEVTEETASIEVVINELRNQSNINFIYNNEEIEKSPNVKVTTYEGSVEEVLEECLKNTGMTFKKINNTIIITPKPEALQPPAEIPELKTQTLKGVVADRDSKTTLPFANVIVLNTNPVIGTTTDVDGNFSLEDLPVGRYAIQASYVGYEDAVLSEILVGSAKEVSVSIELTEAITDIGEIMVSVRKGQALNDMATVSAKSFSVEESKRYAASIGDPARMAQVFAGVSGTDDASNEIVIRGNSPNWLQWRLEGIEIPSPNHFAEEGYSSGAVSILSTNMMGTSDFYTGAFPAEFGSALSGVFDLKLRNGNSEKGEYAAQIGLLGVEFAAEGPFKKGYNGSYLLNYRYSTFSVLNNLGIEVSENTLPNYQDLSFKFNLPTKKAGTFSIWGIGGLSNSDEKYYPDTLQNEEIEDGYSDYTKTGMYATGLGHTIFPDRNSYVKTVISHSSSFSSQTFDAMDETGTFYPDFYDDLKKNALRFSSYYNRKISKHLTARAGVILNNLNYDYFTEEADSMRIMRTYLNSGGTTNLYQAYVQSKIKFTDKIFLTAGIHYAHFELSKDNVLEPRLGMVWNLPRNQKISLGYGLYSKNENLPVYFVEIENEDGSIYMPNKDLKMTRSTHYVAAYDKLIGNDLNIKAEVYYQQISKLPVPTNPDKTGSPIFGGFSPEDSLANLGEGRNFGLELTIQKYFTNNYYFLVTSSLFDSKYKPADGNWYNTRYNINYVNNFVGGKEFHFRNNKMLELNGKVVWTGGKRLLPIDLDASREEGETVLVEDAMFSERASDYFRIDLGLKLHFYKAKTEHILMLDVQNVTNRLNTWAHLYDPKADDIVDYPMAGIIPILSYRIEF